MKKFSDRFTSVVNELYTIGKIYDNREIIVRALRFLPSAWDIKIMVMRESSNLGQMKLHDVLEDLKAYEFEMKSRIEDEASTSTATKALVTLVELPAHVSADPTPIKNPKSDLSECRRSRRDDRKPANNYQRGDNQQNGEGKETQKALIASDGRSEWAYSDSDEDGVTCLMAKEEEIPNFQEEFDFSSEEFTKENLVRRSKRLGNSEWYLDSGCSRHMTGNNGLLTDIVYEVGAMITFGDNSKGRAVGKEEAALMDLLRFMYNITLSTNSIHGLLD
ncbi:uncharacterized protein LOC124913306 [Impatiens glandulifera]|uniref:uncharacterized protein LOC124913306 n=1 Tax=Impatiens glandulifera TaxID=253017 RepID=UPI001FB0D288|nr:uncharacterized protein LOC124913306 [Impatiens glandulifera]